jgi:hypothetical protein
MPQNGAAPSGSGAGFREAPSNSDSSRPEGQAGGASTGSALWNHLLLDAFQLGMRSGNSTGAAAGGRNFSSGGQGFGAAPQMSGGAGGNAMSLDSLFRMASDLSRDLGAGKKGTLGTALGVLPKLNQMTRGGLNLPFSSSLGDFRLSYQNLFGGAGSPMNSRIGYGSPSASFTSTHVRTGKIDFSSTASVGGMSAGMSSFGGQGGGRGAPSGSQGGGGMGGGATGGGPSSHGGGPGGASGGGGRPAASVSLHLSF